MTKTRKTKKFYLIHHYGGLLYLGPPTAPLKTQAFFASSTHSCSNSSRISSIRVRCRAKIPNGESRSHRPFFKYAIDNFSGSWIWNLVKKTNKIKNGYNDFFSKWCTEKTHGKTIGWKENFKKFYTKHNFQMYWGQE